jgi:hypothetical protein
VSIVLPPPTARIKSTGFLRIKATPSLTLESLGFGSMFDNSINLMS